MNNESGEIIRFFNTAFKELVPSKEGEEVDLYPEGLREEIDEINGWVYETVNSALLLLFKRDSSQAHALLRRRCIQVWIRNNPRSLR